MLLRVCSVEDRQRDDTARPGLTPTRSRRSSATEGVARRTCTRCSSAAFACDSADFWGEAEPEPLICIECGGDEVNLGVGFALYPERAGIRWVYVGYRCSSCGVLGCFAEWKTDDGDLSRLGQEWSDAG